MLISYQDKTETKSGYIKGPEREEIISWVSEAWKDISKETIENAFKKAKLLEHYKDINKDFTEEANIVVKELEEIDFDNPYLDDYEEAYLDQTELEIAAN